MKDACKSKKINYAETKVVYPFEGLFPENVTECGQMNILFEIPLMKRFKWIALSCLAMNQVGWDV